MDNPNWEVEKTGVMSDGEIALAYYVQDQFEKQRNSLPSTRILKNSYRAQGFLGEYRLFQYLTKLEEEFDWSGFELRSDDYDFKYKGHTIDVKTRATDKRPLSVSDYEVILDEPSEGHGYQINKPKDIYVFALFIKEEQSIWLLGWHTLSEFKNASSHRVVEKGEDIWPGKVANERIHLVQVKDLHSIITLRNIEQ